MNRSDFASLCRDRAVLLDGATGTNLQRAGLPAGVCPEAWIAEHPRAIIDLQKAYIAAGTRILYAPTFSANRAKLAEFGLEARTDELNRRMVELSRQAVAEAACDEAVFVAGDLTMTGQTLYPLGDLLFEDLVGIYKEQIQSIVSAGADLLVVETMMSLQECRAALLAARETCDLPVMVTLTFQEDGRTLYGSDAVTCMTVLQAMGADAVGCNCSTGPEAMESIVREMAQVSRIPIIAKPNAGLPLLVNDETVYPMQPDEFARETAKLVRAGAQIVGGCCGTTPAHIAALSTVLKDAPACPVSEKPLPRILCSERKNVVIDQNAPLKLIGERINPTGKKALQAALREGDLSMVRSFALQQEEAGAAILDVNLGTGGIDEKAMMTEAVYEITSAVDLPLCIDTSFPEVMEAALRIYPGRALINSISAETERMDAFLPIAKKYGAMFIALPVGDDGLPGSMEEKHANLHRILNRAADFGLDAQSAVADLLVATVGADPDAAKNCLLTLDYCRESLKIPTVCGLSNISFGMPQRGLLNSVFLVLAMAQGLTMAIANPQQEMIRFMSASADLLLHRADTLPSFLAMMPQDPLGLFSGAAAPAAAKEPAKTEEAGKDAEARSKAYACVLQGEKAAVLPAVQQLLDGGSAPGEVISGHLIPAINEVGRLYSEKKYFLPQLIASANAMEAAMQMLEPLLTGASTLEKGRIVIATVQGDIHDIGKNLVALMLRNYGFSVTDLGKDVPADRIVQTAMDEHADVIALSALMTTTMLRMKEVIALAKERGCGAKIIVGGAAVNEAFGRQIGADGYAEDAASCVQLVARLLHTDAPEEGA